MPFSRQEGKKRKQSLKAATRYSI